MKNTVKTELNFEIDMDAINEMASLNEPTPIHLELTVENKVRYRLDKSYIYDDKSLVNCLRNEIVEVRFVPKHTRIIDNKNPMFGGMGENSVRIISVPRLRSGSFVNVLTNDEKRYLEYIMGLEDNALSVYNKHDNFWSNSTEGGISKVILQKKGNRLNLSDPILYIQYKILLADKVHIAPDLHTLLDRPKATYEFVLVSDRETNTTEHMNLNTKKKAYIEYGKIESKYDVLKAVLEMLTMKPVSKNVKLEFLLVEISKFIESDPKTFLNTVSDPLLDTKILIKKAVDEGIIAKRTNFYYLKSTNEPLCEAGEEATLSIAAKYLNAPRNLEIRFAIEGRLNS